MTWKAPLSLDDPISTLVARCFQSFGELNTHISRTSQEPPKQLDGDGFLDELGRLKVWAANIGAHRTGRISLDFRLRDAPHIRTRIQGLLYDLEENIRRTCDIISGASLPWDTLEFDSDSDAESSESELGDEEIGGTEQEQLKNSIHTTITLLSRLSMVIRNPTLHDGHINSSQTVAVAYLKFDVDHVSSKFPYAPSDLANNLGKAISRRREYLRSRKERHEKLAQGVEAVQGHEGLDGKSKSISESMAATSLPEVIKSMGQKDLEQEQNSGSEASQTSFARSNVDDGQTQKIPSFPREGVDGTPFECPVCFMMISVRSQESWKRHVFRDIHPYVCTFPDCTTPQRLFSRRREWFIHELEMHRCHWQCTHGCWGDFKTASQFEDHVRASHPESASPEDLEKLSIASSRPMSQRSLVNCSMCGEKDISLRKLQRHLGRHQEDLALFAMPSAGYDLEEETNGSSKSEDSVSSSVLSVEDDKRETLDTSNATNDGHQQKDREEEKEEEENEPVLAKLGHSDTRPVPSSLGEGSMIPTDSQLSYTTSEDLAEPDAASSHSASAPSSPSNADRETDILVLKHKRLSYPVHFARGAIDAGELNVKHIRDAAARKMDIDDARRIKLLYKGRQLKDDQEAHSTGLRSKSQILCIIGEGQPPTSPKTINKHGPVTKSVEPTQIMREADEEPSRRRSRRPPPIVTQPSTSSSYQPTAAASRPPNNRPQDPNQETAQSASDREFAERLAASLHNLRVRTGNSQYEEIEDERQTRIERGRAAGRKQLRRERQADEFWAQFYRDRQERREEGRKMNEQSRAADDWEARLEEGRRRQQETRYDPSVDAAAPADSSDDKDWEAQLEEGRRRLAELRRTEGTAASNVRTVDDPLRRRNTTSVSSRGQRHRTPRDPSDPSSASRSNPLPLVNAQADIQRAEARVAARRDREQHERIYGAYDRADPGAPQSGDSYNPRLDIEPPRYENIRIPAIKESGSERGQRGIDEARGHTRKAREFSESPSPTRRQQEPDDGQEKK